MQNSSIVGSILLSLNLLVSSCGEPPPQPDPILNQANALETFSAERLDLLINDEQFAREFDNQTIILNGILESVSNKDFPVFMVKLVTPGEPAKCYMKFEQEYYRDELKDGQNISIIGTLDIDGLVLSEYQRSIIMEDCVFKF